ncbi:peptidylprolyl isomerase [Pseudobacter ginsenosidimutans]|uniref:Parvulin-like peptidyl-prolyl cis-trans isomerase protein n=1 Tax=Pseudobacter ginsenosidimutans TaxID=661488 RepID=A0A4V2F173_9BACT|nr:peptidylprolyl isomerase [Pseudobacter ginsenosidimutans]RZS72631.1 parvulin-like peptidyl-prolyl cis-trans isomerase protein [Pseudobacter ginsenosidimutans]
MKNCLSALLLFISASVFAQETVVEKFQKIVTVQQAQQYIDANPQLKPALLKLSAGKDTTLIDKRLLRQKQGDIFSVGYVTYKVLEAKESIQFRASYIFLDGGSLTPSEIESLKKEIMQKINAGESWNALSDKYTMDGNKTKGDTDWFFGEYSFPKEFQDAVQKHNKGDVFFLDVADKDWHYIIKKTYDDDVKKDITVLRANGR